MKVYIAMGCVDYEGTDILGVFTSRESANAFNEAHLDKAEVYRHDWRTRKPDEYIRTYDAMWVSEHEVMP